MPRLLIVGFNGGTHIGGSLARSARRLGIDPVLVDASVAFDAPKPVRAATWRLGHRPPRLRAFSRKVLSVCERVRPRWLLATGLAPVEAGMLARIGDLGISRLVFLTDDPWNRTLRSKWFFNSLREYDYLFSPRTANIADLQRHGCDAVSYLPFGYDPDLFFPERLPCHERPRFANQLAFVGGADRERVIYLAAAIRAGIDVALYGAYWDRFSTTRGHARGLADPSVTRKATSAAAVSLCLVRRANRDGHVMRSFEIPAIGGCMLVEDTDEHRALFGPPGQAVTYFGGVQDMLEQLGRLLSAGDERQRLAAAAHRHIRHGMHTYDDRLRTMLSLVAA